jgi:hypothetical protein
MVKFARSNDNPAQISEGTTKMLKPLAALGFFAVAMAAVPAVAQSTAPPADQTATPPADQGTAAPQPASKNSAKALVASCRSDADSKGLKGAEKKAAVHDCVAAQKPKVADRMQCRQQGKAQGKSGDDLKAFVKDCIAQGK